MKKNKTIYSDVGDGHSVWNYRILAHKDSVVTHFNIHEVYYSGDKPNGYSKNCINLFSEDIDGVRWKLDKMKEAADKPILSRDNFPNEYKE